MVYNNAYVERLVIKACFDNPLLWLSVKPWWFGDPISTDISWKVKGYKKTHGYEPDIETCLGLLDPDKTRCDVDHVRLWLDVKPISNSDKNILFSLFKAQAQLFELIQNHFSRKPIRDEDLQNLRGLIPYFKKHLQDT